MSKYYAVRVGRTPGVFQSWDLCSREVSKFANAEFKSFATPQDAAAYLRSENKRGELFPEAAVEAMFASAGLSGTARKRKHVQESVAAKKPRGEAPLSRTSSASIFPSTRPKTQTKLLDEIPKDDPVPAAAPVKGTSERIVIYTDGACGGNGKRHAKGGIGVFFAEGDPRNISEPLPGPVQTNNRAELLAIIRALQVAPVDASVTVKTDSQYVQKGIGGWVAKWKRNGWKTSAGGNVVNKDLWMKLDEQMKKRHERHGRHTVDIEYIKAHAGLYGNEQADQLAVLGARKH
ncbi:Ribonuclease H1 [Podochytrium sp. JEL0797]|nr:Ribonuclease H1 [Podochytrium sp. JEL0797]